MQIERLKIYCPTSIKSKTPKGWFNSRQIYSNIQENLKLHIIYCPYVI